MKKFSTVSIRFAIGLAVTFFVCLLLLKSPLVLEIMEAKLYDIRFKVRGALKPPDSVVIAVIDEKSLAKLGRWPWGRDVMARLVDALAKADAAVIASDVIFPEPDKNDTILAKAIHDAGNVILPMAFDFEQKSEPISDSTLEASAITSLEQTNLFRDYPPIMSGGVLTVPVKRLKESAMSLAHINMLPDTADGTLRWEALLLGHNSLLYPSLGLRSAAAFLGIPAEKLTVQATQSVNVGKTVIPTDKWGRMPINYFGPANTFHHISIADILDGTVGSAELANRIVFIGATALGIYDLRVTPLSTVMPGVEKHASVAASILEKRFIRKATPLQDSLFLGCTGIILALILSRVRLVWGFIVTLAVLASVAIGGFILFDAGLWINMACPLSNVAVIFMAVTAWNYTFEERYARQIRAMFSSYVTQTIVNELIKNPDMAKLGGEKREITVLFSDVRGFTTFSEQHSPEEVVALLNEYLGAMTDVVLKWEGTLDKFIGDAIVVFWNAPLRHENHPERALLCAVDMIRTLTKLHDKWEREGKPKLSCGIGINTGEVVVGNIGAEGKKMDYTVIGDHVNLGARVESLTRKFDADILVTEMTLDKLRGAIEAGTLSGMEITGLRRVIVKGKEQPVTMYAVKPIAVGAPIVFAECTDLEPLRLTEK